ncbi:MAG: antitoxin [Actinomycetota bacterium]
MKNKLDSDEQIIENEAQSYEKVSDQTNKKIEAALAKSSKKKVITLRLNDNDLVQIKKIALSEGIPYQTLISSVMHKYISNRFIDRNEALKISDRAFGFGNAINESAEIFKK